MERSTIGWCVALCATLIAWLLWEIDSMHINYDWHSYLLDPKTGLKSKPSELLDLAKIINYTQDYIDKTNSIQRLYDLEYNANLENPFPVDQSYSSKRELEISGWPVANQTKCLRELAWINSKLVEHSDYQLLEGQLGFELTQLLDSFGKPETGLYTGTVTWVGSHKQCQKTTLDGGRIRMRYCQAKLRPTWWPKQERVHPKSRIRIGFCLPETCDTQSFDNHKSQIELLLKFDLPEFYKKNFDFDSLFCLPDERSPLRKLPQSGHLYLLVVSVWLSIVITASIVYELSRWKERSRLKTLAAQRHISIISIKSNSSMSGGEIKPSHQARQQQQESDTAISKLRKLHRDLEDYKFKVMEALSVHHSLKEFKSDVFRQQHERHPGRVRVDLGSLDALKILMAITVVLAHSGYLTSVYTRSISNRIDMNVNANGRMVLSASRCVDTFFMLFGLLTSYTLLRKFSLRQLSSPLTWLAVNLGILLRIGPVFMLVYWYAKTVSPYTGSGPWWDYGVYRYSLKGNCFNEPWWKSIPYFGCSGSPPVATCLLPGWFIVSYSQLSLLMPLMTYLIYKLPTHLLRQLLILFMFIISGLQLVVKMSRQTSFREEAFTLYGGFMADLAEKFESTGTMATLGRAGSVSMGCYVGYLLRMYETGQIAAWPAWLVNKFLFSISFVMNIIVVFLPLIGHLLLQGSQHIITMNEFLGFYLVTMFLWPVFNAIVLLNCVTIHNRTAPIRFFSHSFWHIANKLGLCIFLVHWEVLFIGTTSYEQAPSMGFTTDVMKLWSFGVFFTILLAFVIRILFEAPISALLKLIAYTVCSGISNSKPNQQGNCDTKQTNDDKHGARPQVIVT